MKQGTTPTIRLFVKGYDLSACTAYITIDEASENQITYDSTDRRVRKEVTAEGTYFYIKFTQEDTFRLKVGTHSIEVRWIGSDGESFGTKPKSFNVSPTLLQKIIEYLGGDQDE